jgi:hypothetical protein
MLALDFMRNWSDNGLDHFDWSVDSTVIVGLTDIGIATVNCYARIDRID